MGQTSQINETSAASVPSAGWNFTPAPRTCISTEIRTVKGKTFGVDVTRDVWIIAALPSCEKVGKTRWLPHEERWEGMKKGQEPVAWQPWPEHPLAERSDAAEGDGSSSICTQNKDS